MESFKIGARRKSYAPYAKIKDRLQWLKKGKYKLEMRENIDESERKAVLQEISKTAQAKNLPANDHMDTDYKRLQYVRYADDWICGVIGSKEDAESIKSDIKQFLSEILHLELSDEKTLITQAKDKARFLGFEVFVSNSNHVMTDKNGHKKRSLGGHILLYVPREKWQKKLLDYSALKITYKEGREVLTPTERTYLINSDDLEILNQYNAEIRGIYNYYRIADSVSVLGDFYYVMKYSLFKTFAAKYKTRISRIRKKYGYKRFGVEYQAKKGTATAYLYDDGFKRTKERACPPILT